VEYHRTIGRAPEEVGPQFLEEYGFVLISDIRASKRIPAEVSKWLHYMKRQTGASFFILSGYTNALGELAVSRSVMYLS